MTDLDFVAALERESARFLTVLRDTDPAAPVPSCPDWDVADLLWQDRTVGYVRRRQAHEALEPTGPRVDVRVTDTGVTVPVVLGRFTGTDPDSGASYDEEDLSVRAAAPATPAVTTVSGSADDLDAWLRHRRDAAVLAQPID